MESRFFCGLMSLYIFTCINTLAILMKIEVLLN